MNNLSNITSNHKCILCGSNDIIKINSIKTEVISYYYRKKFNIDTSIYFNDIKNIEYYDCNNCNLIFFSPSINIDSSFYESLNHFHWYYRKKKTEYIFCSKFTENKDILEIGCGEGNFVKYAKASSYKGIEFNQQAINKCKKKCLNVDNTSINKISKKYPNKYDVVCTFQVLEHVKDPIHFIQNALSCLKQHGLLIFSVPSEDSFVSLARNNVLNMPPHHVSRWKDMTFNFIAKELKLDLILIHHEELEQAHYNWYTSIVGQQIVRHFFLQTSKKLFDYTLLDKLTTKLGSLLGVALRKPLTHKNILPKGHTVIAIFRKP